MSITFAIYYAPDYPEITKSGLLNLEHLLPNPNKYCWSPGDFNRPWWFQYAMKDCDLEKDFDFYKIFEINENNGDGFCFKQDWNHMAEIAKDYLQKAEEFQEILVRDSDKENVYSIVKYYLECVLLTAEYALAQEHPEHYYIAWC